MAALKRKGMVKSERLDTPALVPPDTNTMNSEELRKYLAKLEKEGGNKKNT